MSIRAQAVVEMLWQDAKVLYPHRLHDCRPFMQFPWAMFAHICLTAKHPQTFSTPRAWFWNAFWQALATLLLWPQAVNYMSSLGFSWALCQEEPLEWSWWSGSIAFISTHCFSLPRQVRFYTLSWLSWLERWSTVSSLERQCLHAWHVIMNLWQEGRAISRALIHCDIPGFPKRVKEEDQRQIFVYS